MPNKTAVVVVATALWLSLFVLALMVAAQALRENTVHGDCNVIGDRNVSCNR